MIGRSAGFILIGIAFFGLSSAMAANPAVPVDVGGDPSFPACEEKGVLNEREAVDGRVEIRSGPTRTFDLLDRLPVETEVYTCDEKGTFVGIVYGDGDCGLNDVIERRSPYRGACASGWVHNRSLDALPLGPA